MGGGTGSDDEESAHAFDRAVELGCNLFDTAWAYGSGHSERLLGALLKRHLRRAALHGDESAAEKRPLARVERIDLQQLHVWDDSWVAADGWKRAIEDLKRDGLIQAFGISVDRWQPANVLRALETGLVDSVQVVYNIFDQSPEDDLFPACQRLGVAVIARAPFDEGSLTGTRTPDTRWPDGDWRNIYFGGGHLAATLRRVDGLQPVAAAAQTVPDERPQPTCNRLQHAV
jgi:aryl-alcohol dehydrogenase-like predicted oxidoreductase